MIKNQLTVILLLVSFLGFAQTQNIKVREILENTQNVYKALDKYSVQSKYVLYKGMKSNDIEQKYSSLTIKSGEKYYSRIHNTEFLFLPDSYLKINHEEKRFEFSQSEIKTPELKGISVTNYLALFDANSVKETDDYYICSLFSKAITALPYGKIELHINKLDFQLHKQVFYLSNKITFKHSNGDEFRAHPRLEVVLSSYKEDISHHLKKMDLKNYVVVANGQPKGINEIASYQYVSRNQ